jgi:hypothetical protein
VSRSKCLTAESSQDRSLTAASRVEHRRLDCNRITMSRRTKSKTIAKSGRWTDSESRSKHMLRAARHRRESRNFQLTPQGRNLAHARVELASASEWSPLCSGGNYGCQESNEVSPRA